MLLPGAAGRGLIAGGCGCGLWINQLSGNEQKNTGIERIWIDGTR